MSAPKHASNTSPEYFAWLTPQVRRWAYGIITAAVPLLVVYGIIEAATAPLWLALAASVLGTATALAHTPAGGDS